MINFVNRVNQHLIQYSLVLLFIIEEAKSLLLTNTLQSRTNNKKKEYAINEKDKNLMFFYR